MATYREKRALEDFLLNKGIKAKDIVRVWNADKNTRFGNIWQLYDSSITWDQFHTWIDQQVRAKALRSNGSNYQFRWK